MKKISEEEEGFFGGHYGCWTRIFRIIAQMLNLSGIFRVDYIFSDGDSIGMEDDVISRLVEDAIDSESREILTMSRSRSVQLNVSQPVVIGHLH